MMTSVYLSGRDPGTVKAGPGKVRRALVAQIRIAFSPSSLSLFYFRCVLALLKLPRPGQLEILRFQMLEDSFTVS